MEVQCIVCGHSEPVQNDSSGKHDGHCSTCGEALVHLDTHGQWRAREDHWSLRCDFDSFGVVIVTDSDRLRALLTFNYNHGPTGAVEITRQFSHESNQDFIDRVVEEFLNEHPTQDECDQYIGQYAL